MRKSICLLIVLFYNLTLDAQTDIALGTWRTHTSYYNLEGVIEAGEKIYGYNSSGLFYFDKEDNSLNKIGKLDGLSRMDISILGYSAQHETLLVAYQNGDVDLVSDNRLLTFKLISQSPLAGSKKINQIIVMGEYAYLLSDFGITLVSISNGSIKESYLNLGASGSPLAILQGAIFQDSLFLATPAGIMAGSLVGGINLQDFNNWRRFSAAEGLPSGGFQQIMFSNQLLYALKGNSIYQYQSGIWNTIDLQGNPTIRSISAYPQGLLICLDDRISILNGGVLGDIQDPLISSPRKAIIDTEQKIWLADGENGLVSNLQGVWNHYTPQGPLSNQSHSLQFLQKQMIALPTQRSISPSQSIPGFSTFNLGTWQTFKHDGFENITDAAWYNGLYHFSSMKNGLLTWDGKDAFEIIDAHQPNVSLSPTADDFVLVSTLEPGPDNRLWMINYQASNALHYKEDATWEAFNISSILLSTDILIPSSGHVWMKTSSGITIYDVDNDTTRVVGNNGNNGRLPSQNVHDMAEDQDGYVWVATASGVAYFNNIYSVFTQNAEAVRPIYDNQYLFTERVVSHVLIDPANRKWFATAEGISVFSAFLDTLLFQFSVDNSPLPSNQILDMAFDGEKGEIFISTTSGMVSYRDGATSAGIAHLPNVKVFPNPVTPGFTGQVGISGLANNAFVKITDVSGRLVFETRAQGGTAIWDVNNLRGQRVGTGIYLVLSSNEDGTDTMVAKVVVVN